MTRQLRVGIIGASADRGWAKVSHVPAVQHLAGLELAAVASGSQEKSDAAARAFGAKSAFGNAKDLLQDPDIDIVSICVKVPNHREGALVLDGGAAPGFQAGRLGFRSTASRILRMKVRFERGPRPPLMSQACPQPYGRKPPKTRWAV